MASISYKKLVTCFFILIFGAMLCYGGIWRLDIANRTIEYDQGIYLYTSDRIARGLCEYPEDFDNKMPGVYYLYMLAFKLFGNSHAASQIMSVINDFGILIALVLLGGMLGGRNAGLAAGGLYACCYLMLRWAGKGSTETPMTLFALFGCCAYVAAVLKVVKGRSQWLFAAGALCGIGMLFKQPALFVWLTLAGHLVYLVLIRQLSMKGAFRSFVLMQAGFWLVLLAGAGFLAAKGILRQGFYNAFLFSMETQHLYGMPFAEKWFRFRYDGVYLMPGMVLMAVVALVYFLFKRDERRIVPLLYVLPVMLFFIWTGDFYQHYFIQLVPGLVLAAALLLAHTFEARGKLLAKGLLLCCLALFIANNHTRIKESYIGLVEARSKLFPSDEWHTFADHQLDYQLMVGRYLRRNLDPGDKLVTSTPTYAYLAGVPTSYRFTFLAPMTKVASKNGFADLPAAVEKARFLIIRTTRIEYLPSGLHGHVARHWRRIEILYEPEQELEVWENPSVRR